MRIGRTSTYCLLAIVAGYGAATFVGCAGDSNSGTGGNTGGPTSNTTSPTGTTIIITGSGGAGGGTTGGTGGSGAGGGVNPDAACLAEPRAGEQVPLDLFFMVDKSGSMGCPVPTAGMCESGPMPPPPVTRWTSIKDALGQFLAAPQSAGLGVGIGFFPQLNGNNVRCTPQDYASPAAPINPLPGSAAAVQMAINAQMPSGNTPTTPALSGAVQYVTSYAQTHPGRTVAIVFASDGLPTSCMSNDNTIDGAGRVAEAAFRGTPSIRTYVLGVGPSLQNLNTIASKGGTGAAHLVESGGSGELLNALNEIRKNALTCDYQIPVVPGKVYDLDNAVAIRVKVGANGMEVLVPRVADPSQCGPNGGGWFFDVPPPNSKKITLCPATCDPLIKTTGSSMTVLMGCKIIVPPPD